MISFFFSFFFTGWGLLLLSFLDASVVFWAPLANDVVVVLLSAQHRDLYWLYPLLATVGSLAGSGTTYWLGHVVGEKGLERFHAQRRLERLKRQVRDRGAWVLALTALVPPPFPLTALVLTCGALGVNAARFFPTLAVVRLVRYAALSLLAVRYGRHILSWLHSGTAHAIALACIAVVAVGSAFSGYQAWRPGRSGAKQSAMPSACSPLLKSSS